MCGSSDMQFYNVQIRYMRWMQKYKSRLYKERKDHFKGGDRIQDSKPARGDAERGS